MSTEPTGLRASPPGPAPALTGRVGERDASPSVDGGPVDGGRAVAPVPAAGRAPESPARQNRVPDADPSAPAPPPAQAPTRRRPAPAVDGNAPATDGKAPNRRKRKVRKVHRVVRHIEVWSVAKITAVFVACGYVVLMISGYLLWRAADRVGTIDGIEGFMEDSGGYDSYQLLGDVVFKVAGVSLAVLGLLTIAAVVLGTILFNLVSDVTGGIRMTVIDEDLIVAPARRPEAEPARRPEADAARRPEVDAARRPEADAARRPEVDAARRPEVDAARRPEAEPARRPEADTARRPEAVPPSPPPQS